MRQFLCRDNPTVSKGFQMTTKAEEKLTEKEQAKADRAARAAELEAKEKELNKDRTGKGTRVSVSLSRGRNPQPVEYEAFDESQPETLPKTLSEFMELTKIDSEPLIVGFLIGGYNDSQYTAASDPVAEYVDPSWPDDVQKGFRIVVRNYATNANVSIEDAVALIKPGIIAAEAKKAAAKSVTA